MLKVWHFANLEELDRPLSGTNGRSSIGHPEMSSFRFWPAARIPPRCRIAAVAFSGWQVWRRNPIRLFPARSGNLLRSYSCHEDDWFTRKPAVGANHTTRPKPTFHDPLIMTAIHKVPDMLSSDRLRLQRSKLPLRELLSRQACYSSWAALWGVSRETWGTLNQKAYKAGTNSRVMAVPTATPPMRT